MNRSVAGALLLAAITACPAAAQYSARYDGAVVRLGDARHDMVFSILPGVGEGRE